MSASHAELNSIFNRQKVQLLMRVDAANESIFVGVDGGLYLRKYLLIYFQFENEIDKKDNEFWFFVVLWL